MIKNKNIYFIYFFSVSLISFGQNISPIEQFPFSYTLGETVTTLSNSLILVFQSQNGDYWFGSDKNGVYRFDGKKIIHYSTKDGLLDNRIRSIQEDQHGNIYFSTLGGINKFNGISFTTLLPTNQLPTYNNWKLQSNDLWFYMPGKNGEKGPYRFDGTTLFPLEFPKHYMETEYFKKYPNNAWSPYEVYYIYKDPKGIMWFGTSNFGICRYDGTNFNWIYEEHLTNTPNGGSFGIRSILADSKGYFWFCNTKYKFKISPDSIRDQEKTLVKYKKKKGISGIKAADGSNIIYFMSAIEDKIGDLWLVTYQNGVWRYNGKNVTHYPMKIDNKIIKLYSIYLDIKGEIWLGSHDAGVFKYNGKSFDRFQPKLNSQNY